MRAPKRCWRVSTPRAEETLRPHPYLHRRWPEASPSRPLAIIQAIEKLSIYPFTSLQRAATLRPHDSMPTASALLFPHPLAQRGAA